MGPLPLIVHAAGGGDIGVGHLRRAGALAGALAARPGLAVHQLFEAPAPLARRFAAPSAPLETVEGRAAALARRDALLPGAYVTDLLHLRAEDAAAARAAGAGLLVHLDDTGTDYPADVVVDPERTAPPSAPGEVLAGPRYRIVDPRVRALRPAAPWAGERARRILLAFGGADPGQQLEALAAGLAPPPGLEVRALLGPAVAPERAAALAAAAPWLGLLPATDAVAPLLLEADLVVTLGGLTTFEAMALGRPAAAVAWAHMTPYVARLAADGLAAGLGPAEQAAPALLGLADDGDRLRALARAGHAAIDGAGAERVADHVAARLATDQAA